MMAVSPRLRAVPQLFSVSFSPYGGVNAVQWEAAEILAGFSTYTEAGAAQSQRDGTIERS
jgi:hypothetical protein